MTGSLPQSPLDRLIMKVTVLGEANRSEIVDASISRTLFIASIMALPAATRAACRETPTFEGVNGGPSAKY
jgi:hypothetical protein